MVCHFITQQGRLPRGHSSTLWPFSLYVTGVICVTALLPTEQPALFSLSVLSDTKLIAGASSAGGSTVTAPNLDALWAKLQQQHSLEADAARLTRRANSGTLVIRSDSKAESLNKAGEQVGQQAVSKETDSSRLSGHVDVSGGPVSSLPTPGTQQQQQKQSEAEFWKMMQNS